MTGKSPLGGQTPFRVKDDPDISQLAAAAEYDPELDQIYRKLTKFWVTFDAEYHSKNCGVNGCTYRGPHQAFYTGVKFLVLAQHPVVLF